MPFPQHPDAQHTISNDPFHVNAHRAQYGTQPQFQQNAGGGGTGSRVAQGTMSIVATIVGGLGAFAACYLFGGALMTYAGGGIAMWVGLIISGLIGGLVGQILRLLCGNQVGGMISTAVTLGCIIGIVLSPVMGAIMGLIGLILSLSSDLWAYVAPIVHCLSAGLFVSGLRTRI